MLAEAGISENPFSFGPMFGLLFLSLLVGLLLYLVLQRIGELLIGRTDTSVREVLFYISIVALMGAIITLIQNLHAMPK
jgi:hypothetical protein